MKAFSAPASVEVVLVRGDETIVLRLTALPMGYAAYLERAYPQPTEVVNGVRVALAASAYDWRYDQNLLNVAKALGEQLDAKAPTSSDPTAWSAYAKAVREELTAANLTEGHLLQLVKALHELHQIGGDGGRGKAS